MVAAWVARDPPFELVFLWGRADGAILPSMLPHEQPHR